jgi:hypothetical protein
MGYREANAMRYEASPEAVRDSMASLARATRTRRQSYARRSDAFFADAGQSEQDYRAKAPRPRKLEPSPLSAALDPGRSKRR